jgi:hypothetical protein
MCFITTKSAKAKIAKEDIVCWKVLRNDLSPLFGSITKGGIHNYTTMYLKGVVNPKVEIKKEYDWLGDHYINQGYHSYKNKPKLYSTGLYYDFPVCKFIIPKGTKYYSNYTEYVSETIIML